MTAVLPLLMSLAVLTETQQGEAQNSVSTTELMPPWGYSAIAFGIVLFALALLWAFRSVGKRH